MAVASWVSLADHNTLGLQASAEWFVSARNREELDAALNFARERQLPVRALGEGSNVILQPRLPGLVLHMATRGIQLRMDDGQRALLRCAAGENWHQLVLWCCEQGLHGLENLALIPGSVGAAPVQNIGAYGVEVSERVAGVEVVDVASGAVEYLSAGDCGFGYRTSRFKQAGGENLLITAVDLCLDRDASLCWDYPSLKAALNNTNPTPKELMQTVMAVRLQRLPDPAVVPNVGSFFKNPILTADSAETLSKHYPALPVYPAAADSTKLSAAWMIDQLGWRGREQGGVAVSEAHSLVLVNRGADTAEAVLALASAIQASVLDEFGVTLELEPQLLGVAGD
jgi:UDP-N-acetylmuramate dehydrogenase